MQPMLATRGDVVPTGADWRHEVKWDGMRLLVEVGERGVRACSRTERDVSVAFPELRELRAYAARGPLLLDGEVVALGQGVPTLAGLADRIHVGDAARAERMARSNPVTLLCFDLLRLGGQDLMARPLSERRARLEELDLNLPEVQVPPAYEDGPALLGAAEQQSLEGIVSKRLDSRYHPGRRSRDWLKFPIRPTASFLVGGWRPEVGSERRLGALLVGQPTAGGLRYRGRVGSGLAGAAGQALADRLAELSVERSPFATELPRVDAAGTRWVRPELVVDVEYLAVTADGRLRQPAYRGLRTDLTPGDLEIQ